MKDEARSSWLGEAGLLLLISLLLVSAGYLVRLPIEIPLGRGVLGALTTENFHEAEGEYRWTRGRSSVVIPDPGPGLTVRIDSLVSGVRRRGQSPPLVVMEAGGETLQIRPTRGDTLSLVTATRGWWSSDLEVLFRSETFMPSEADQRALGVRVHQVRLVPEGPPIGLGRAPLRQLVTTSLGLLFLLALLRRHRCPHRRARWIGLACAFAWGLGFAFARAYAALASTPFLVSAGVVLGLDALFPSLAATLAETIQESVWAARRGLRLAGRPSLGLVVAGTLGVAATYIAHPSLEIDLGSGRETTLVNGFAGFDQADGISFRRALQGARIDLSDFGGATTWKITVTASLSGQPRPLVLARAGSQEIEASLGSAWADYELQAKSPLGWRSGLMVELPAASDTVDLRVDRVRIERGASLPSLRIIAFVVGAAFMSAAAFAACGLTGASIWAGAAALLLGATIALGLDPVLILPFIPTFFASVAGGAILSTVAFSLLTVLSRRGLSPRPVPVAVGAVGLGFAAWLSATAFPLYDGGHFLFHSSIAEEIWQGKFLTYYLPYPGSMLSRQAQWGNLIIPHPCLFQTLVAPLAALPREWFYVLEKAALALMFSVVAIIASLLATRVGSPRAGAYAGVIAVGLPPTFQLLGLGHLMTLFGVCAATMALGFIILRFDHLERRSTWWWTIVLLTLSFLSYTASLLMTAVTLALALPFLWRKAPGNARALFGAALCAATAAFFLYYVNWVGPFLKESLPLLLSGVSSEGADFTFWDRLTTLPGKLAYSYGSVFLPLAGVFGLALARASCERVLLLSWAGILILFSGTDLFFNFLLKHHYFVIPTIAVGCGLLAAKISEKKRWGWVPAAIFVVYILVMGGRIALLVALGEPPGV